MNNSEKWKDEIKIELNLTNDDIENYLIAYSMMGGNLKLPDEEMKTALKEFINENNLECLKRMLQLD